MEPLDQDAVNLSKAIRQTESGGNFQAKGKSGEYGAYQYTAPTWDAYAKKHGVNVSLDQATPEQQNEVTYKQIKEWKDSGYNPGQIASLWNSGKPDAYLDTSYKGVNKMGVSYDVPAYAKSVATAYQKIKSGGEVSIDPSNPSSANVPASQQAPVQFSPTYTQQEQTNTTEQPQEDTLGSHLKGRFNDANQAVTDLTAGKQGIASTVLQSVGALAGGVGDMTNSLIEHIPVVGGVVKGAENLLGKGVSAFFETDAGKGVLSGISQFSKDHPELSKDIGAGINVISAIPILKGLGVVSNLAKDATATAFKGIAEKAAKDGLTNVVGSTKTGIKYLQRNPDAIETLVKERALPDIVDNRYHTKEAFEKLQEAIMHIDENELTPVLDSASTKNVSQRIPLERYKNQAMADAVAELKDTGPIESYFERLQKKYGDYPTLKDMNDAKRTVSRNITDAGFNSPTYSVDKIVRSILQKSVEDGATALGLPDVAVINQKMASLIKAQDALSYIENKSVKSGLIGDALQTGATAAGAAAGAGIGFSPEVSAYMANRASGVLGKKIKGLSLGVLERTGKGAERTSVQDTLKGSKNLTKGLIGQGVVTKSSESLQKQRNTP